LDIKRTVLKDRHNKQKELEYGVSTNMEGAVRTRIQGIQDTVGYRIILIGMIQGTLLYD
jgi:hypothetical protein